MNLQRRCLKVNGPDPVASFCRAAFIELHWQAQWICVIHPTKRQMCVYSTDTTLLWLILSSHMYSDIGYIFNVYTYNWYVTKYWFYFWETINAFLVYTYYIWMTARGKKGAENPDERLKLCESFIHKRVGECPSVLTEILPNEQSQFWDHYQFPLWWTIQYVIISLAFIFTNDSNKFKLRIIPPLKIRRRFHRSSQLWYQNWHPIILIIFIWC